MALGCSKHLCKLTDRMIVHVASVLVAVREGTQALGDRGVGLVQEFGDCTRQWIV